MQDLTVIGKVAERAASAARYPGRFDFDWAARDGALGRVRGTA
jgi:hypothetical protein